jgi:hypothetical protein
MPRQRAIASAIATCAAARLVAPALNATESSSAAAVGRLAMGAAAYAQATLAAAADPRQQRRLLAQAERQLRFAHVLSVQLHADGDPAAIAAAASFTAGAQPAAGHFARLARRPGRRLERRAVRALRRTARMHDEVAATLAAIHDADSPAVLRSALREVLEAQRELVVTLDATAASDALAHRRRRSLRAAAAQARETYFRVVQALARVTEETAADAPAAS